MGDASVHAPSPWGHFAECQNMDEAKKKVRNSMVMREEMEAEQMNQESKLLVTNSDNYLKH